MTNDKESVEREPLLNLSGWIERRKDSVGPYADHIIHSVKAYEDHITALVNAYRAGQLVVNEWRSIEDEEPPKDGTLILLSDGVTEPVVGAWLADHWVFVDEMKADLSPDFAEVETNYWVDPEEAGPIYWRPLDGMPLPAAPKETNDDQ